ncbi:CorA family divalent cation transporter [Oricola sp.]|uniref:CorA family divalent cation transporter n=1 Tax=Oricola sp. TaxID=1979950 RepID=UPI0025ED172D|nr:CorA family divalent cation transporter [Oricola sp.]MCI5077358.1 magnesium transporter CorA [Oricola sp.]
MPDDPRRIDPDEPDGDELDAEAFDKAGRLFTYAFDTEGHLVSDDSEPAWRWTGYGLTDARARSSITALEDLPVEARRCLLASGRRVFIKQAGGWIYGTMPDIHHRHYTELPELGLVHFALNARTLVTARKRPLQTVDDIRHDIENARAAFASPAAVVDAILSRLLDQLEDRLEDLFEHLDSIEDRVIGGRWTGERDRLAPLRRRAIQAHRHLFLVAGIFRPLPTGEIGSVAPQIVPSIENSAARAGSLLHDSEQLQARALLVQEEIMARLSERTNKLLYLLSVLTAVLMPVTIISGLFGMNVQGIPFTHSPLGFWEAAFLSAIGSAAIFLFVRRQHGRRE